MINFIKYRTIYFLLSLLVILPSSYFLIRYGLNPSADFTGGALLELRFTGGAVSQAALNEVAQAKLPGTTVQQSGVNSFIIRAQKLDQASSVKLQQDLADQLGPVEEKRFSSVGPTLGQELIKKTIIGIILAAGFILVYVAIRFKDKKYGICAVLAMLHDTLILIGTYSIASVSFGAQADSLLVTAVLTILSFSVHDTIVVYDRIRETLNNEPHLSYGEVVNRSINQTLTRSINNSLTIIFMLLALFLLGGETIRWFIFALLIGTITGTYSSTFTAAPLLVVWENLINKKR